jgi:hypothetical protein
MRQMTKFSRRQTFLLAAGFLVSANAGCGVLDQLTTFEVPFTYEIPRSVPIAYPGSERLAQIQNNNEDVYGIVNYLPIDISSVLPDNIPGANAIEEVRVVGITMTIEDNTLDTSLQEFDFRVGEPGTELLGQEVGGSDWGSALSIGVTPVQPAGHTGAVPADMVASNLSAAGQRIADLSFGFGIGTSLVIPEGDLPAGGVATVRFTLHMELIVSAIN